MAAKKSVDAKPVRKSTLSKSTAPKRSAKASPTGNEVLTIDRRRGDRRPAGESEAPAAAAPLERRQKVQRRRQIDPTTCERDYSIEEVEFMNAMDDYKRTSGRMFPTCSEVLEVIRSLGYARLSPAGRVILAVDEDLASGDVAEAESCLSGAF